MDKIIDKLSAYNIFTNLFPGTIFCFLAEDFFGLTLIQDDLVVAFFLYYFCGMVISRVSSIVIEPLMKKIKFVTYADYKDYVAASAEDEHLAVLLETSNSYRSVVALLICLFATGVWTATTSAWPNFAAYSHYAFAVALLVLFSLAFRKQTRYIVERVSLRKRNSEPTP